jgi:hypothetical protein
VRRAWLLDYDDAIAFNDVCEEEHQYVDDGYGDDKSYEDVEEEDGELFITQLLEAIFAKCQVRRFRA